MLPQHCPTCHQNVHHHNHPLSIQDTWSEHLPHSELSHTSIWYNEYRHHRIPAECPLVLPKMVNQCFRVEKKYECFGSLTLVYNCCIMCNIPLIYMHIKQYSLHISAEYPAPPGHDSMNNPSIYTPQLFQENIPFLTNCIIIRNSWNCTNNVYAHIILQDRINMHS